MSRHRGGSYFSPRCREGETRGVTGGARVGMQKTHNVVRHRRAKPRGPHAGAAPDDWSPAKRPAGGARATTSYGPPWAIIAVDIVAVAVDVTRRRAQFPRIRHFDPPVREIEPEATQFRPVEGDRVPAQTTVQATGAGSLSGIRPADCVVTRASRVPTRRPRRIDVAGTQGRVG